MSDEIHRYNIIITIIIIITGLSCGGSDCESNVYKFQLLLLLLSLPAVEGHCLVKHY